MSPWSPHSCIVYNNSYDTALDHCMILPCPPAYIATDCLGTLWSVSVVPGVQQMFSLVVWCVCMMTKCLICWYKWNLYQHLPFILELIGNAWYLAYYLDFKDVMNITELFCLFDKNSEYSLVHPAKPPMPLWGMEICLRKKPNVVALVLLGKNNSSVSNGI